MFPKKQLYQAYLARYFSAEYSSALPDTTKRSTLENMNHAISLCECWDSFLDIGGAGGHYSASLTKYFSKGTIVEVGDYAEHDELVRRHPNITICKRRIEDFDSDKKYNFVLLADVFEHIPDIISFVSKLASLQAWGDVVYILTPNPIVCGPARESCLYHTHHPYGHVKHYTEREIVELMSAVGYKHELTLYEETPVRQICKRVTFGLARRDKNWNQQKWYKPLRPFFLAIAYPLTKLIEFFVYRHEHKYRNDRFATLAQCLIFKKSFAQQDKS